MSDETRPMEAEKQEMVPSEGSERTRECRCFMPRADIYESDEMIVVVADLPGVAAEAMDITLENDTLTINGYGETHQPEGYALAFAEYEEGDYQRVFRLSDKIDREGIQAVLRDGVLELHLPKAKAARTRKIGVKAG